jgi:hypothetical protein
MSITPEQHLSEARTYLDAARKHLGEFERTSALSNPPSNEQLLTALRDTYADLQQLVPGFSKPYVEAMLNGHP